jgi:recombination associated protein RdgC
VQLLDKVRKTEFIGREFLAWLWFRAETGNGAFELSGNRIVELWFDGKITLQTENDRGLETITCAGENQNMKEARFSLMEGKDIIHAAVKLLIGDNEWSFALDSTWMNFKAFKTPKVIQDKKDDPDGIFYEKLYLIEEALSAIDEIYISFIKLRVSPEWANQTIPALIKWISETR